MNRKIVWLTTFAVALQLTAVAQIKKNEDGQKPKVIEQGNFRFKSPDFDDKTKIGLAYDKIIEGKNHDFNQRLRSALIMEQWADVNKILSELSPQKKRDIALPILKKISAKVKVPMTSLLDILKDCPGPITDSQKNEFIYTVQQTLNEYGGIDLLIKQMQKGFLGLGGEKQTGKEAAYKLLIDLGLYEQAPKFLITTTEAKKAGNLKVVIKHFEALAGKCQREGRAADYIRLRELGLWLLKQPGLDKSKRAEIERKITPALGFIKESDAKAWFIENFRKGPKVEKEIILGCIDHLNKTRNDRVTTKRDAALRLQKRMIDSLIEVNKLDNRGPIADILANYWLGEVAKGERKAKEIRSHNQRFASRIASGMRAPRINHKDPGAPSMAVLQETAPKGIWVEKLPTDTKLKLQESRANIYINVENYKDTLEVIREFSAIAPKRGIAITEKMLQEWAKKSNPNNRVSEQNNYASRKGIPLTRTKQLRNLKQLKWMIAELRKYLKEEINETILVDAFIKSHSNAEIYKLKDIKEVLGSPETLSEDAVWILASRMRKQLKDEWRKIDIQKAMATKRTKQELEELVEKGYTNLLDFMNSAIKGQEHPYLLQALMGVINFEYFEFKYNMNKTEEDKLSKCFEIRNKAFKCFDTAVKSYAKLLAEKPEHPYSIQIFSLWFDILLNASSTNTIDGKNGIGEDMLDAIRKSIERLPENTQQAHIELLAEALLVKCKKASPAKKIAYFEAGKHISKGSELVKEYQRYLDYYKELLSEVKLGMRVDGSLNVGREPFGVFVSLFHTPELAREAGGFGQYLSKDMPNPFQRRGPPVKALDNFTENLNEAFHKQFDVLNMTFCSPSVKPHTFDVENWTGEALLSGVWEETPLAYVTLRAKDEAVDSIPGSHMDLFFVDMISGVAIPVRSNPVRGLNCSKADKRPTPNLEVTQVLDQRDLSKKGIITLEIEANANGVIPKLNELLELPELAAFKRQVDNGGFIVKSVDSKDTVQPVSSASWSITYELKKPRAKILPNKFTFPKAKNGDLKLINKIYDDANLKEVQGTVPLDWADKKPFDYILWGIVAVIAIICLIIIVVITSRKHGDEQVENALYEMPETVTPFTVIQLLQNINAANAVSEQDRKLIKEDIKKLEEAHFSPEATVNKDPEDLKSIVLTWLKKVRENEGK